LSATTYTISGTDSDSPNPDTGTWTYSLTVTPDTIVQGAPTSGSTTTDNSGAFSSTLTATSGFQGQVTFATSTAGFIIANGNELESTGTLSASSSPYTISGTDSDLDGDAGTWTYTLTVLPSGSKTTIVQLAPTSGTTLDTSSSTFTAGPISTENNIGAVTFVTTKANADLLVSSSGLITTSGALAIGTYTVSGTDSDLGGDRGTWTYVLTVTGVEVTVTFDANGGSGVMASETQSQPTALALNVFTWAGHTFVRWNTSPNGSGTSYANGAVFPFGTPTTLFAQWKAGREVPRAITFRANGGKGAMRSEVDNTPTAISANRFSRSGYTFVNWNTAATGSGKSFAAGATYSFKSSVTLYAQWKKNSAPLFHLVKFAANGGKGAMAAQRRDNPSPLTPNHFSRSGYTFVNWNTAASGRGAAFANGALYPFAVSVTLYAQWKKDKSVAPHPIQKSALTIGPFAAGSSTVSTDLQSLVRNLANIVKTNKDSQIALLGYGDTLTPTSQQNASDVTANVALAQKRAQAVATFLQDDLNALGLKGWTISLAASTTTSRSGLSASGYVIASLS
jgi:uncharacterized repeat protein (TIGR02543 family)